MKAQIMETPKTGAANEPGGNSALGRGIENAGTSAHQTIDKVSAAAQPVVDRVASSAHSAVDTMTDAAAHAAESLGVKGEQLKDAQLQLSQACSAYMRANPLAALGIAVAAGFVLSRLVSGK